MATMVVVVVAFTGNIVPRRSRRVIVMMIARPIAGNRRSCWLRCRHAARTRIAGRTVIDNILSPQRANHSVGTRAGVKHDPMRRCQARDIDLVVAAATVNRDRVKCQRRAREITNDLDSVCALSRGVAAASRNRLSIDRYFFDVRQICNLRRDTGDSPRNNDFCRADKPRVSRAADA